MILQNQNIIKININTGLTEVVGGLGGYGAPPSGSTNFVLSYDGNTIYYHTGEEILKIDV